jgi:hypothetical protein
MDTPRRKDRGRPRPIASRRSSLARLLVLAAVLAAISLGMTAAYAQPLIDHDAEQAIRQHERASQDQVGPAAAEQAFRHRERASQEQPTTGAPANVIAPVRGAEPGGQPGWLMAALGVGAAAVALLGGLTVLAARRTRVKIRPRQAA